MRNWTAWAPGSQFEFEEDEVEQRWNGALRIYTFEYPHLVDAALDKWTQANATEHFRGCKLELLFFDADTLITARHGLRSLMPVCTYVMRETDDGYRGTLDTSPSWVTERDTASLVLVDVLERAQAQARAMYVGEVRVNSAWRDPSWLVLSPESAEILALPPCVTFRSTQLVIDPRLSAGHAYDTAQREWSSLLSGSSHAV